MQDYPPNSLFPRLGRFFHNIQKLNYLVSLVDRTSRVQISVPNRTVLYLASKKTGVLQTGGVAVHPSRLALAATASTGTPGGNSQSFAPGNDVSGTWWTALSSRKLTLFVEEAVRRHPDVESAEFALRAARETVFAEQGALSPQVTGTGSAAREQGPLYKLFNTSVSVSYALDLWGGTRRQLEALEAQADYQTFKTRGELPGADRQRQHGRNHRCLAARPDLRDRGDRPT
ncbi:MULTISPECIES: TolC family protein [Bradyrhizobium]|uniref:TolC family protein n=1 Tax=Bradyrhizobium TaxID=374 RepID=UPI0035E14C75